MIEYNGHEIPDDDDELTELIRRDAHQTIVWDYRDDKPPSPIDWVSGLLQEHPELVARVEKSYAQLLAGADPIEVREILEQAASHPGNMMQLLADAVAQHADALRAAVDSTNDSRSVLGAVVEKLDSLANGARVPTSDASALASIDDPSDGWPTSFRLALTADFDANRSQLLSNLQRLETDDEALMAFVRGFIAAGSPLTDRGLEEIGKGPIELREKVAAAVKQFVADSQSARQTLLNSPALAKYPPEIRQRLAAPRPDPWPDYAARLGVQP